MKLFVMLITALTLSFNVALACDKGECKGDHYEHKLEKKLNKLDKKLNLSDNQRDQIGKIMRAKHEKISKLKEEMWNIKKEKHSEIRAVLNDEQKVKWDKKMAKKKKKMKRKKHGY